MLGFTLIELIVVIGILGVLATVLIVIINPGKKLGDARDAGRKSDARALVQAFEEYYLANGSFPITTPGTYCLGVPTGTSCWSDKNLPGNTDLMNAIAPYMKSFPHDPQSSRPYGDQYLYTNGSVPTGANLDSPTASGCAPPFVPGHYILWRPDTTPTKHADCGLVGFQSCCPTGGPCNGAVGSGNFCALRIR